MLTCFIEKRQPDGNDEELRLLGPEVNGEIHIISFLGIFTNIIIKKCFSKC